MISRRPGWARSVASVAAILSGLCAKSSITVTPPAVADGLQPALQPFEAAERGGRILERHAERARRGERGQRVRRIVAAGHREPHVMPLAVGFDREA